MLKWRLRLRWSGVELRSYIFNKLLCDADVAGPRDTFWILMIWWLSGKESTCQCRSTGSILGSGRAPGEGHGNPLQYSCLGEPMDREDWRGAETFMTWMENTSRPMKWQTSATLLPLPSWINFFKYGFQPCPPLRTTTSPLLTAVAINTYNFGFALCCHQHRIWRLEKAGSAREPRALGPPAPSVDWQFTGTPWMSGLSLLFPSPKPEAWMWCPTNWRL